MIVSEPLLLGSNQLSAEFVPTVHGNNGAISFGSATLGEGVIRVFRENVTLPDSETTVAQNDYTMLAVLAVPTYMTPADFLTYVAPAEEGLAHLRLLR